MKRLAELNAKFIDTVLVIDCPCGQCDGRIRIPVGPEQRREGSKYIWAMTGTFPDTLTLQPSVSITATTCPEHKDPRVFKACPGWHGWITRGNVRSVEET